MKILDIIHNPNTVDIVVEIDNNVWETAVRHIIQAKAKNVKVQGFRTGKVPFEIANKYVNRLSVYESAGNKLINQIISDVENDDKFKKDDSVILGAPSVEFKEVDDNHCVIVLKYELEPVITIPDYKKIQLEGIKKLEVSEKDIDDEIQKILEVETNSKNKETAKDANDESNAESKDDAKETKKELPKLTDSLVASWNIDNVKTIKDLRRFVKENLHDTILYDNRKVAGPQIAEYLLKNTTISYIPNSYLNEQIKVQLNSLNDKLKYAKITKDKYLKLLGMDERTLYERIKEDAKNAVIVSLALENIIKKEKVSVKDEQVKDYVNNFAKLYHVDADKFEKEMTDEQKEIINVYVLNNNVIDKLIELNTK